ncbi:hypothetical protein RF11_08038 [Thelohanellus kitauei]|uniref:Uncharacterized protein n=1 Tax=Thelohanellus kitauei TaxID=669202 RepID=A0A0C2JC09_THEKT|nr:hypothetical protein RF11_08038 [Thelohanellus kitauei]
MKEPNRDKIPLMGIIIDCLIKMASDLDSSSDQQAVFYIQLHFDDCCEKVVPTDTFSPESKLDPKEIRGTPMYESEKCNRAWKFYEPCLSDPAYRMELTEFFLKNGKFLKGEGGIDNPLVEPSVELNPVGSSLEQNLVDSGVRLNQIEENVRQNPIEASVEQNIAKSRFERERVKPETVGNPTKQYGDWATKMKELLDVSKDPVSDFSWLDDEPFSSGLEGVDQSHDDANLRSQ